MQYPAKEIKVSPNNAEIYNEQYRPQFHFTSRTNWLNDPNGLVFYEGVFHLFYQHNPTGILWGNMHWGHAVSYDLIHWNELPIALFPDELGTMYSGSAAVDWHNTAGFGNVDAPALVAMYTAAGGTNAESEDNPYYTQCLAFSTDNGKTWTKYSSNPVLPEIVVGNRDPKIIWHEESHSWIMFLHLDGEQFGLFKSPDLQVWQTLQTLEISGSGECPNFFPMHVHGTSDEVYWVLTDASGSYLIVTFDGNWFNVLYGTHKLDNGRNFYAVQTYSDIPASDGRRIQIAWMRNGEYPEMPFNQQMGFPCTLTLHRTVDSVRIRRMPIAEIEGLRGRSYHWETVEIAPGHKS